MKLLGWGKARLQTLVPISNLDTKLADDLQKEKEKAEKTAKNLVQAAMRRNQARETKEVKRQKKNQANAENAVERLQLEVEIKKNELNKIAHAEREESHVQDAIEKALALVKPRTSVPLTVLAPTQPSERSARAKAMQSALKAAEEQLERAEACTAPGPPPETPGQDAALGVQAVMVALRNDGSLVRKTVVKAKKDDKALTTSEMRKLGKHLLK